MIFLFSTYSKIYHLQRSFTNIFTLEPVRRVSSVTEITHIFKQVKLSSVHITHHRTVMSSCHRAAVTRKAALPPRTRVSCQAAGGPRLVGRDDHSRDKEPGNESESSGPGLFPHCLGIRQ